VHVTSEEDAHFFLRCVLGTHFLHNTKVKRELSEENLGGDTNPSLFRPSGRGGLRDTALTPGHKKHLGQH
jgi:hypothetical protein